VCYSSVRPNWPITMYRTTELANFAGLANSPANWPIRQIFMKLMILVIIVFSVLTDLTCSSASPAVSPKADLAVATSQNPMLYRTIRQFILFGATFQAEVDVDTPIFTWLPKQWFCIRALLSPQIPNLIQPIQAVKTIDISLPASSPSKVNFMPSSPPPASNSVQP